MSKIKLLLRPDEFTSFHSNHLQDFWNRYFTIELFDEKKFQLKTIMVKYPSYPVFRKNLCLKGVIKKEYGRYKWISIEPNIIMATELIKLYLSQIHLSLTLSLSVIN